MPPEEITHLINKGVALSLRTRHSPAPMSAAVGQAASSSNEHGTTLVRSELKFAQESKASALAAEDFEAAKLCKEVEAALEPRVADWQAAFTAAQRDVELQKTARASELDALERRCKRQHHGPVRIATRGCTRWCVAR